MRAAHLYGLNDQVGDDYRKDKTELVEWSFRVCKKVHSRNRGIKYKHTNQVSGKKFPLKLKYDLENDLPDTMNFLRTSIAPFHKQSLKDIVNIFNDEITHFQFCFKYIKWCLAVLDSIKSKLISPIPARDLRKPPENIFHIVFCNKAVELINPFAIFSNTI